MFRGLGKGVWVSGLGCRGWGFGVRGGGLDFGVSGLEFVVWCLVFGVFRFRSQGWGSGVAR